MPGYDSFFTRQGLETPTGSRVHAARFGGYTCPDSMSFGRTHGTAPAVCEATYTNASFSTAIIGTKQTAQIDGATFVGIVVRAQQDVDSGNQAWRVKMIDMRDRLHDKHVFCQINMMDSNGRFYHIYPNDWPSQTKSYITAISVEEMDKDDSKEALEKDDDCAAQLVSAYQILYGLANKFNFTCSASDKAIKALKKSYPDDLDWNNGIKVIDAIQQVVEYCGMQFSAWGDLNINIDIRGEADNPFIYTLLTGDPCDYNFSSRSIGAELNERGNIAVVVGGPAKVELCYPCKPAWNENFTEEVMFNGVEFARFLEANGLTYLNTMKELEDKNVDWSYQVQNYGKWRGKSIGEMTIREYMETFPFRVYAVDFSKFIDEDTLKDKQTGGDPDWEDHLTFDLHTRYPISDKLITQTERNFLPSGSVTIDRDEQGKFNPIRTTTQRAFLTEGVSLDIEQLDAYEIDNVNCIDRWHVRLQFSKLQYRLVNDPDGDGELPGIAPDKIAVRLAVDLEKFRHEETAGTDSPRQREIVRHNETIRQGFLFISDKENTRLGDSIRPAVIGIQAESPLIGYYSILMEAPLLALEFGSSKYYADEAARVIAKQMLWHEALTTAGHIVFEEIAGFMPDGLIDNVNLEFTPEGVTETANFSTQLNDPDYYTKFRSVGRKPKVIGEKEIREEHLKEMFREAIRKGNHNAVGNPVAANTGKPGGNLAGERQRSAFSQDNQVVVRIEEPLYNEENYEVGDLMILRNPGGGSNQLA